MIFTIQPDESETIVRMGNTHLIRHKTRHPVVQEISGLRIQKIQRAERCERITLSELQPEGLLRSEKMRSVYSTPVSEFRLVLQAVRPEDRGYIFPTGHR